MGVVRCAEETERGSENDAGDRQEEEEPEPFGHRTIPHQERIRRDERQRYEEKEEIEEHRICKCAQCLRRPLFVRNGNVVHNREDHGNREHPCDARAQKSKEGGEFVAERVEQGYLRAGQCRTSIEKGGTSCRAGREYLEWIHGRDEGNGIAPEGMLSEFFAGDPPDVGTERLQLSLDRFVPAVDVIHPKHLGRTGCNETGKDQRR